VTTSDGLPARTRVSRWLTHPVAGGTVGFVVLIGAWWLYAASLPGDTALPTPLTTVSRIVSDGWAFYGPNIGSTLSRAGQGYLWGNLAGLLVAAVVFLIPALEQVVTQLGVLSQCLPITAVGPIIMVIFGGRSAAIFLAALLVFFTTLVGTVLGMRSASSSALDLVTAYGGGRLHRIVRVQLPAALPAMFTALKIAVPGAVLGAIVGEYLGGIDSGLGVALNAAQRSVDPARAWGVSIVAALVALAGYALVDLLGRLATPWAHRGIAR
jgi:ABC-type nitrate/sulfonate/bicarbonate transport system permease component